MSKIVRVELVRRQTATVFLQIADDVEVEAINVESRNFRQIVNLAAGLMLEDWQWDSQPATASYPADSSEMDPDCIVFYDVESGVAIKPIK